MTGPEWITRDVLITVKAIPRPSRRYGETVCVAGLTKEEGLIRLYPVMFRDLPDPQRFKKYQWVNINLRRHAQDSRPESYRPDTGSFKPGRLVGTSDGWATRKELVLPLASQSMCEIMRLQEAEGRSLGVFKPATIEDLVIEDTPPEWGRGQKEILGQQMFFTGRKKPLEKVPFTFKYKYRCAEAGCPGHTQSIIDWEIAQLYRKVRRSHSSSADIERKIHKKFFEELCGPGKDTYFFTGNMAAHRKSFLILGVFWPPSRSPSTGGLFA